MRLVVIGGVAAGLSAAARARRKDPTLEIVVFEKGPTISYGACGLPYYIDGRVRNPDDLVVYTPEYFQKERNVTVRTGARVASIAHPRRQVILENGEATHYDRLVIATGARMAADISGSQLPHVFPLLTLEDGKRLKSFLTQKRPKRAVVIGAGYIGLEAADALRRNGLDVALVESSPFALHREDAELTAFVARLLEQFRVELRCGVRVKSIEPERVGDLPCDLVIQATGLVPNADLAGDAGIDRGLDGAIRVDERLETNIGGIFAAGDCAEVHHLVTGRQVYFPLGTTANKMGRVAGANAAGGRERFPGIVGTSVMQLFGTGIATTGLSAQQARREGFSPVTARIEARSRPAYFKGSRTTVELIADRGSRRLLGGMVLGEQDAASRINVIAAALHSRMRIDDFEQLDLAYAPPFAPVWDPLLVAAQQLIKQF